MKWTKHRQDDWPVRPQSSNSELLPHFPATMISPRPLAASFVDQGTDFSPPTTLTQTPPLSELFITRDIEALLEEDERARAQERQAREAEFGRFDRVAPSDDPSSIVGGLPPPPRAQRVRHYKIQSEHRAPIASGRSSDFARERNTGVGRPSITGGATPSSSVASRSSIKGVPSESAASVRTADTYSENDSPPLQSLSNSLTISSSVMHSRASLDEARLVNRLSDFGPKAPRRSSGRDSWGAESHFSDKMVPPNAALSSSLSFSDVSKTTAQHPFRPLLSHAPLRSRESIYSSVSSYDPASTVHDPRISVSSTIYPASAYNELPSPVAGPMGSDQSSVGNRTSLFHTEADSVYVEDQRHSIINTSAHASPERETSVPQRTAYASPVGIYPIGNKPIGDIDRVLPPRPLSSTSDLSFRSTSGQKPALPTTPKPDFRRSRSVQPPSKTPMISKPPSPSSSPKLPGLVPYHLLTSFSPPDPNRNDPLPPTTNYLDPQERADLIRKTRKLTQVFGQTPSPMSGSEEVVESPVLNNCLLPVVSSRKAHARGAMSVSDALNVSSAVKSVRDSQLSTTSAERTTSLSPIRFRTLNSSQGHESDGSISPFDSPDAATPMSLRKKSGDASIRSPTIISASDSFIEMTEYDSPHLIRFPSTYSFAESMTDEQQAEEERRRKRERLAKLHRFLGSRVPMELILGPGLEVPLPPLAPDPTQADPVSDGEASSAARLWLRGKRRNSLASSDPLERLADSERVKEELSEKEKAIVVKRALKMERLFGEQPPQDLFHSGQPRPTHRAAAKAMSQSKLPAKSAPSSPVGGNVNKSAYRKGKSKSNNRPGTADSSKRLLGPGFDLGETESINDGQSDVYYHYRSSLVSLTNIVDNDDRKSLVELHEYINEDLLMGSRDKRESHSGDSIRSERRRSLPLRASHTSLASQYTISEATTEITPFEVRRRRAAKLSHFFGVSYRDLFGEVLESLEMSVREDEGKGTLNADEAKDLLVQLTKLKARRDELS